MASKKPYQIPAISDDSTPDFRLTTQDARRLAKAFNAIAYDPKGADAYICQVRKAAYSNLPMDVLEALSSFNTPDSPRPYMVIDGLPIDADITGSPRSGQSGRMLKSGTLSENLLVGIASVMNRPYAVDHESPELVANLVPSKAAAGKYTGEGFDRELGPHTENARQAHLPLGNAAPTELALLGLRSEPHNRNPRTLMYDGRRALEKLTPAHQAMLRGDHYVIMTPHRWRHDAKTDPGQIRPGSDSVIAPLVTGPAHAPQITIAFYPDMIHVRPDLPAAQKTMATDALAAFRAALDQVGIGVRANPGRMLVINNRYALHAREKFAASFDDNGNAHRWVQRVFTGVAWNHRGFARRDPSVYSPTAPVADTDQTIGVSNGDEKML